MAAGSISLEEFRELALKLAEVSAKLNDSWRVTQAPSSPGDVYLEKTSVMLERTPRCFETEAEDPRTEVDDVELEDPEEDPGCMQSPPASASYLTYQFHVVYSHSYAVPVLYFNVFRPDGQRVKLEELWAMVPSEYQARMQEHKWATLTQQEHPLLGCPYFMLHPCHTATLMSQVPNVQDKRYYLIKWLSSVGPVVGLEMLPAYATAFDGGEVT
ncbi:hypothetical protein BaRGS_00012864 [Batillaria attramentaria]|uniref:Ubiquitin-like-conjugating enzyme ATG10 n=1 Tax=Batillaria attramentaria TaxID=370345 RepID=A0ABD0L8Z0_9CAEN